MPLTFLERKMKSKEDLTHLFFFFFLNRADISFTENGERGWLSILKVYQLQPFLHSVGNSPILTGHKRHSYWLSYTGKIVYIYNMEANHCWLWWLWDVDKLILLCLHIYFLSICFCIWLPIHFSVYLHWTKCLGQPVSPNNSEVSVI